MLSYSGIFSPSLFLSLHPLLVLILFFLNVMLGLLFILSSWLEHPNMVWYVCTRHLSSSPQCQLHPTFSIWHHLKFMSKHQTRLSNRHIRLAYPCRKAECHPIGQKDVNIHVVKQDGVLCGSLIVRRGRQALGVSLGGFKAIGRVWKVHSWFGTPWIHLALFHWTSYRNTNTKWVTIVQITRKQWACLGESKVR